MNKLLFIIPAFAIGLTACSKPTHNASEDVQNTPQVQAATKNDAAMPTVDSEHNTQNSVDWHGVYTGLFPCADCSGIKTHLKLNPDNSYELIEKYEGKGDGKETKVQGKFSFDDTGSIITLDKNAEERKFFVGEGFIEARAIGTGEKIESPLADHYKLNKEPQ